jgi:hypothetical protein
MLFATDYIITAHLNFMPDPNKKTNKISQGRARESLAILSARICVLEQKSTGRAFSGVKHSLPLILELFAREKLPSTILRNQQNQQTEVY